MNLLEYEVKRVHNPHEIDVCIPGSKSITNRALLIAALADGRSVLSGVLFSDDSRHFLQSLIDLGFDVDINEAEKKVSIAGRGGAVPNFLMKHVQKVYGYDVNGSINVGSAGTAARFLTAYLGLSKGRYFIDSSEQMKKRPMKELLVVLEQLGATIIYLEEEFHFPFIIGNDEIKDCEVTVDVDKSSQFLSALLISSVLMQKDFKVNISGHHGMAYVDMTVKMMKQFGVTVVEKDNSFCMVKDSSYSFLNYMIEPDVSAACYFYAMSPLLKVPAKVRGIHLNSLQGDIQFLNVLCKMGCTLKEDSDGVVILPPSDEFIGGEFNLSSFSDQALTLAAIAPFAKGAVIIRGISHIRHQECDRINAIISNLKAMKVNVKEFEDGVMICQSMPCGTLISTFEDHRVAMSFSLCGLLTDGVIIENPMCCRKTFETYFDVLESEVY